VPLGYAGSTVNDELNRLANGGTYPPVSQYKDQGGAAQAWAAARGVALGSTTDVVGVLNLIGGITSPANWLDIAGICNKIAGTTNLEPSASLSQVAS